MGPGTPIRAAALAGSLLCACLATGIASAAARMRRSCALEPATQTDRGRAGRFRSRVRRARQRQVGRHRLCRAISRTFWSPIRRSPMPSSALRAALTSSPSTSERPMSSFSMPKASRWSASTLRSRADVRPHPRRDPADYSRMSDVSVEGIGDGIILTGTVASQAEAQQAFEIASHFVATGENFVGSTGGGGGGGGGTSVNVGGSGAGSSTALALGSSSSSGGAGSQKIVNAIVVRGRDQVMLKVTVAEVERDLIKQLGINLSGSRWLRHRAWSISTTPIRSPPTVNRSAAPASLRDGNRSPRRCRQWSRPASSIRWPSRI